MTRHQGTVKFFNPTRGFGFISVDGEADVFVHATELPPGAVLSPGDRVSYELDASDRKGVRAVRVALS